MAAAPPAPLRQRLEAWLTRQWQQPRPTLTAQCLQPLAWLYGALARRHARAQQRQARRAPRPLIVVGNLVAGGAGKTPTVMALVAQLRAMGHQPGVISRGHGRSGDGVVVADAHSDAATLGDEPLLIHR
ncbi:MAG: tetraacyldisaccharide 4'-kinase, partial [Burkholderiales bacterium PBB5]